VSLADQLGALVGADRVRADAAELRAHARDCWPRLVLAERTGVASAEPEVVVRPRSTAEVAEVLRFATSTGTPVTPYGAGSGVVGGAVAVRGGVLLDLSALTGLVSCDDISGVASFRAGTLGPDVESAVNERGWTVGHFPSSIMCSTVGGWVAARGAGQLSSRYGKAEDLVVGIEAVLPDGTVWRTTPAPRTAAGPDLWRLLAGAEGTLGVVTEVTFRLSPLPAVRRFGGWLFPSLEDGLVALRDVMRTGARPAVLRLYDALDTTLVLGRDDGVLLVTVCEGHPDVVAAEEAVLRRCCAAATDLGTQPAEHWWAHRYDVSFNLPRVLSGQALGPYAFADTIEVAALWSLLPGTYDAMKAAMSEHAAVVFAHVSHCYPEGASIYWSFASDALSADDALARYDAVWSAAMAACRAAGGTIAHHHGVGQARAPWLAEELGAGYDVLRAVKAALDPAGVCNPGKLGL
jgi:alkyldihydroxyacetonephosphate synthase